MKILIPVLLVVSAAAIGSASCHDGDDPPVRIPCGDQLDTSAEDDACVIVPLWAVEGGAIR